MCMNIKKSEFFKVHAYMVQSLKDKPLAPDDIRIAIYIDDVFEQELDVPASIPDESISAVCAEVFGVEVDWEHFSEPHRFTGAANRRPPATGNKTTYSRFD